MNAKDRIAIQAVIDQLKSHKSYESAFDDWDSGYQSGKEDAFETAADLVEGLLK